MVRTDSVASGRSEDTAMSASLTRTSTTGGTAKEMIGRLSVLVMESIRLQQQTEMLVVDWATWFRIGHFPRSSERVTRPLEGSDTVVFISHRWWSQDGPDDEAGTKYASLCRGLQRLAFKHRLCSADVVIWCDWACIDQDDLAKQRLGIASLITYVASSAFFLIPVGPDVASVSAFQTASHPMMLHNYGERAWCRLEAYIFMCVAEVRLRPSYCYGFGPIDLPGTTRFKPRERLRPLVTQGASFDLSRMPSSGVLSTLVDRATIEGIQEEMRNIYVHKAILEEKLKFTANARTRKCKLQAKQMRCTDVPMLISELFSSSTTARVVKLHLASNLLGAEGAALLMKGIVCMPQSTLLQLDLSNNPQLGLEGVTHIARGLADTECRLVTLKLASCALAGAALFTFTKLLPLAATLQQLDLSRNQLDDATCEALLEACGGCDNPTVTLDVEGNPISSEVFRKAEGARAAVELGFRSMRSISSYTTCTSLGESRGGRSIGDSLDDEPSDGGN